MMGWLGEDMPQKRRPRRRTSTASGSVIRLKDGRGLDRLDGLSRRRPGSQPFGARLEATSAALGMTTEDERYVQATSAVISAHVEEIADDVHGRLMARPEFAAQFFDQMGHVDHERLAAHRGAFRDWLACIVRDPLDADTGEYVAGIGHALARNHSESEGPLKARYLVETIARVQTLLVDILAPAYTDPQELAQCAAAWSRRLVAHLDVLLAVYSATQGTPHWY